MSINNCIRLAIVDHMKRGTEVLFGVMEICDILSGFVDAQFNTVLRTDVFIYLLA